jgi:long-chain fatty acid transport protein
LTAVATTAIEANAGGFALREQSSIGQGTSFAGVAAGGSLSSMFWNPATMTQTPGIGVEAVATAIFPYATHNVLPGSTFAALGGAGDSGNDAFVPAGYASWQFNRDLWLGLSMNSPFGLSVSFPSSWAGRDFGQSSSLTTYNATPSFAYRINDWISIGAGVQIQYAKASLGGGATAGGGAVQFSTNLAGSGYGYGFTGGITVTPGPNTSIGLGYRSQIDQKLDGTLSTGGIPGSVGGAVNTTVKLPGVLSLGLRHRFDSRWTAMGTIEWSNWSRLGVAPINLNAGGQAVVGGNPAAVTFNYRDGWFYSVGAEYQLTPQFAFRAGVGYERTPVQDQFRTPLIPDNDRIWLSVGASNNLTRNLRLDVAYSHLFVRDPSINLTNAAGATYVGSVNAHVDIVSVALKYSWDDPAPTRKLITK